MSGLYSMFSLSDLVSVVHEISLKCIKGGLVSWTPFSPPQSKSSYTHIESCFKPFKHAFLYHLITYKSVYNLQRYRSNVFYDMRESKGCVLVHLCWNDNEYLLMWRKNLVIYHRGPNRL